MTPEFWTLHALRPQTLRGTAIEPAFVEDRSAWRETIEFATRLHAAPVAAERALSASWVMRIPSEIRSELESLLRVERMRLALLENELDRSLHALLGAGLPVTVLKGMDLGRRLYTSRLHRPMTDVDLWVPDRAWDAALQAMAGAGYHEVAPSRSSRVRREFTRASISEEATGIVELHRHLQSGDSIQMSSEIWSRTLTGELPGLPKEARILHPSDQLAYLIRHCAIQHRLESPIWLNDLFFVLEAEGFDPSLLTELSVRAQAGRFVSATWFCLYLLKLWSDAEIPHRLLKDLARKSGLIRTAWLGPKMDPDGWFLESGRGLRSPTHPSWLMTRLMLRDDVWNAFSHAVSRDKPLQPLSS